MYGKYRLFLAPGTLYLLSIKNPISLQKRQPNGPVPGWTTEKIQMDFYPKTII
jgi:hypothetical protein